MLNCSSSVFPTANEYELTSSNCTGFQSSSSSSCSYRLQPSQTSSLHCRADDLDPDFADDNFPVHTTVSDLNNNFNPGFSQKRPAPPRKSVDQKESADTSRLMTAAALTAGTSFSSSSSSTLWIVQLRRHVESECCNVLQSKVISEDGDESLEWVSRTLPLSLRLRVIEEKFQGIGRIFQNILREARGSGWSGSGDKRNCRGVAKRVADAVVAVHQVLVLVRYDGDAPSSRTTQALLLGLIRARSKMDKLTTETCNNGFGSRHEFVTQLIEFGRLSSNLRMWLVRNSVSHWVDLLRRLVRVRTARHASVAHAAPSSSGCSASTSGGACVSRCSRSDASDGANGCCLANGDKGGPTSHSRQRLSDLVNDLLTDALGAIIRNSCHGNTFIEMRTVPLLLRICSLGPFRHCWQHSLRLLAVLAPHPATHAAMEKICGYDVASGLLHNFSVPEEVLAETARVLACVTLGLVHPGATGGLGDLVSSSSSRSVAQIHQDGQNTTNLRANADRLINSLMMAGSSSRNPVTVRVSMAAVSHLVFLFPEVVSVRGLRPRTLHSLVAGCCLSLHEGLSVTVRASVSNILANLSVMAAMRGPMIASCVLELCLQFLSDHADATLPLNNGCLDNCCYDNGVASVDLVITKNALATILNLCSHEGGAIVLLECSGLATLYRCAAAQPSGLATSIVAKLDSVRLGATRLRHTESAGSSLDIFLQLDTARESEV